MSERIRGIYDDALYKSTYTLLYYTLLSYVTVCTISFFLKPLLTVLAILARGNINISFPLFNIRSLKIVISIIVYFSMYNLPVVTSRCVNLVFSYLVCYISSYCARFMLCILYFTYITVLLCNSVRNCECHIDTKGYSTYLFTYLLYRKGGLC